jgi:hypothetical protein
MTKRLALCALLAAACAADPNADTASSAEPIIIVLGPNFSLSPEPYGDIPTAQPCKTVRATVHYTRVLHPPIGPIHALGPIGPVGPIGAAERAPCGVIVHPFPPVPMVQVAVTLFEVSVPNVAPLTQTVSVPAAGGDATVEFQLPGAVDNAITPGAWGNTVLFQVDPTNAYRESNESDNTLVYSYTCIT